MTDRRSTKTNTIWVLTRAVTLGVCVAVLAAAPLPVGFASPADATPTAGPSGRHSMGMATNPGTIGGVVMFGGRDARNRLLGETWVWNGVRWKKYLPATPPPARTEMGMAYDAAIGKVVLFGGLAGTNSNPVYLNDTWTWDGTNWTQVFPAHSPPAREDLQMAYDHVRGTVVMFGGFTHTSPRWYSDTWIFDGVDWTQLAGAPTPLARADHSMADSPSGAGPVLFGGWNNVANPLGDTWTVDGTGWTEQSPATPPSPRGDLQMEYDPDTATTVLFGGQVKFVARYPDTWLFDGTNWTQAFPAMSPAARTEAAMAYDARRHVIVLFAGNGDAGTFADTWTWDGSTWTQVA